MDWSMKVLQKAVDRKDHAFIARKLVEKLRENGWEEEDIAILAEKLKACCR